MVSAFEERYGIEIIQGWGMTEMSPLGTVAVPPAGATGEASIDYRAKTGRIVAGVDLRIVDPDGNEQPWDGESMGEIEVRGPWITASYHGVDTPEKFDGRVAAHRRRRHGRTERVRAVGRPHQGRDQVGR